jgi:hypothetical protein
MQLGVGFGLCGTDGVGLRMSDLRTTFQDQPWKRSDPTLKLPKMLRFRDCDRYRTDRTNGKSTGVVEEQCQVASLLTEPGQCSDSVRRGSTRRDFMGTGNEYL